MRGLPLTVIETAPFLKAAERLLAETEQDALKWFLAMNPEAGDIIPETGGVRKLRWSLQGRGRRGGSRVIYYFASRAYPVFLLDIFAKNVRIDLTAAERKRYRASVKMLTDALRSTHRSNMG